MVYGAALMRAVTFVTRVGSELLAWLALSRQVYSPRHATTLDALAAPAVSDSVPGVVCAERVVFQVPPLPPSVTWSRVGV